MKWAKEQGSADQAKQSPPKGGAKKALLIGINYIGTSNELGGCINDARNEMRVLTQVFGFEPKDILLLTEDQNDASKNPTCANIRKGMKWLTSGASAGDLLFFAYSGHGSQMPTTSSSEEDGQDECICPLDCMDAPWPKNIILDNELNEVFLESLPNGVKCLCVFDCCHSGSMEDLSCTRELFPEACSGAKGLARDASSRYLAPPAAVEKDLKAVAHARQGTGAKARVLRSQAPKGRDKQLWVISGCQDNQTSADATIGGVRQGALTWGLVKALSDHKFTISYDDLLQAVRANLRSGYEQVPQLSSTCESNFARLYLDGPVAGAPATLGAQEGGAASLLPAGPEALSPWRFALLVVGVAIGLAVRGCGAALGLL